MSIPAVSTPTHTLPDSVLPQYLPELPARIMTALIAVEHHSGGLTTRFPCNFQRFHGESAVRRERHCPAHWFSCKQVENNGEVCPALTRPDIGHITAPHWVWLRYGELSLKMIRDGNVLMTATLIPVSRLLATDQPQLFHEPAGKPAPHLIASLGYHSGDASCSGRTVAGAMQLKYLTM